MEGTNTPIFGPTVEIWPAEPPAIPRVQVDDLVFMAEPERCVRRPYPIPEDQADDPMSKYVYRGRQKGLVELPEDFCFRECLEVDPDDSLALFQFIDKWGRLTPFDIERTVPFKSLPEDVSYMCGATSDRAKCAILMQIQSRGSESIWRHGFPMTLENHHLHILRAMVHHHISYSTNRPTADAWIHEGFKCEDEETAWWYFTACLNAALRSFTVHVRINGAVPASTLPQPSAYEAAALQLAKAMAGERTVRECANERCGRFFTRQRGRAKYENTSHGSGVKYCSHQCAKAQSERNRRDRIRASRATPEGK